MSINSLMKDMKMKYVLEKLTNLNHIVKYFDNKELTQLDVFRNEKFKKKKKKKKKKK